MGRYVPHWHILTCWNRHAGGSNWAANQKVRAAGPRGHVTPVSSHSLMFSSPAGMRCDGCRRVSRLNTGELSCLWMESSHDPVWGHSTKTVGQSLIWFLYQQKSAYTTAFMCVLKLKPLETPCPKLLMPASCEKFEEFSLLLSDFSSLTGLKLSRIPKKRLEKSQKSGFLQTVSCSATLSTSKQNSMWEETANLWGLSSAS